MPLLDYLRDEGVVAARARAASAPLDRFLDEYRDWLAVERELSPDTVRGYTRLAAGSSRSGSRPRTSSGWRA